MMPNFRAAKILHFFELLFFALFIHVIMHKFDSSP
jgi:hypothetical protein